MMLDVGAGTTEGRLHLGTLIAGQIDVLGLVTGRLAFGRPIRSSAALARVRRAAIRLASGRAIL